MKKIHHRKPLPTTGEEKGCQTHLPAIVGTSQALSETPVKAEQRQAVVGGGGKGEESPGQHCHRRKPHRNRLGARHLRNVTPPHRRCSSREGSPDSCSILDMPPFMSTNNMSAFLLQLREPNRNLNFPKPPRNPSTSAPHPSPLHKHGMAAQGSEAWPGGDIGTSGNLDICLDARLESGIHRSLVGGIGRCGRAIPQLGLCARSVWG